MSAAPPPSRSATLQRLGRHRFDLIVIGGGITGAGIARDAARRGLDVALIEQGDFASGTSSRSSRLIHGGVRYLEHGYLHLVFEASRERRLLLRLAPHLVRPLRFTWPVYDGARIPRWKLRAGLLLYDLLAMFRNVARHRGLSPDGVLALEPTLDPTALRGGASYYDAATDDTRLTIATLVDAARAGATVVNHAEVTALRLANGVVGGVSVLDRLGGQRIAVEADCVVNATGPWSDVIRRMESPRAPTSVRGTKGVHLAVWRERVGNVQACTLLADDGRVMFALPAGKFTIFGTTDTVTTDSPESVRATRADVRYLLAAANRAFPAARLTEDDVFAAWAGIRPLIARGHDEPPSSASREHAVTTGPLGVITVTGGKLTTYRVIAADVVHAVLRRLGKPTGHSHTDTLPLPGGLHCDVVAEIAAATVVTRHADIAERLVRAYGTEWREVWRPAEADWRLAQRLDAMLPYTAAEVVHAVEHEWASGIGDILIRRTHIAFESREHGLRHAPRIAEIMAPLLGWTDRGIAQAIAEYRDEVRRIFEIQP